MRDISNPINKMRSSIDENFRLHAITVPGMAAGMQVRSSPGMAMVDSGLACDTFNILHIHGPVDREAFSESLEYYKSRDLPYCIWVNRDNLTEELKTIFREYRITRQNEEVGMKLDLEAYESTGNQRHAHIRRVKSMPMLEAYAEVIAANWMPPDHEIMRYYQRTSPHYLDPDSTMQLFVYTHQDTVVSTVEIFPSDKTTAGIYSLTTLTPFRGLGIGTAMMTHTLNMLKSRGFQTVVLQASVAGLGIYKRLGFKESTTFYEYA